MSEQIPRMDVELTTRRSFLLDAGRYTVLAGMLGAAGVFLHRGWDCHGKRKCQVCQVYDGCELDYKQDRPQLG